MAHLKRRGLDLSMDGRYDSPGFSASNCTVSAIDLKTNLILEIVNKHKKEIGISKFFFKYFKTSTYLQTM